MTLREKMFSFDGRLRRADYWGISIALGLATFVTTETVMLYGFGPEYSVFTNGLEAGDAKAIGVWPHIVQVLISLLTIWPNFAMTAKRAHDRDQSARRSMILLAILWGSDLMQIPLGLAGISGSTNLAVLLGYLVYGVVITVIAIYLFVTIGTFDGTPGPNRFGPSPKAVQLVEAGA